MIEYFDFSEAMQWIDFGEMVGIELAGKIRFYYRNQSGILMCKVNNVEYPVKQFYLDAIESKNWWLCS